MSQNPAKRTLDRMLGRVPDAIWEAVDEHGDVVATWRQHDGSYQTEEWVRENHAKHYPDERLRVTRVDVSTDTEWVVPEQTISLDFDLAGYRADLQRRIASLNDLIHEEASREIFRPVAYARVYNKRLGLEIALDLLPKENR